MYKILHIPTSTFLKIHIVNAKLHLTKEKAHEFQNSIWSDHDISNYLSSTNSSNFIELKLQTQKLAELYLQSFIKGLDKSVLINKDQISLYNQENFYEIVEEE